MIGLLDTSVISQFTKGTPEPLSMAWLEAADPDQLFLSVISVMELRIGIERMPLGRRRSTLSRWLELEVPAQFKNRILPVTHEIADEAGRLLSRAQAAGFNIETADTLIAATGKIHRLDVATLDRKHFEVLGVSLVEF